MAKAVHPRYKIKVLGVDLNEPYVGCYTEKQNYRKEHKREGLERLVEAGGVCHEGESDYRSGQHVQENRGATERLVPGQRARTEEAPVLRREQRRRLFTELRRARR